MKRAFLIALSFILCLGLLACSSTDKATECTCCAGSSLAPEAQKYVGVSDIKKYLNASKQN